MAINNSDGAVSLAPLRPEERLQFRTDLQEAFMAGLLDQLPQAPSDGPIPSDADVAASLDAPHAVAFHILLEGQQVGGVVLAIHPQTQRNALDFFFVKPGVHGRGIGQQAWALVEKAFPETVVWETHTPYFEKRNIHFYVNKCGFKIVEFFNDRHPDPHDNHDEDPSFEDGMFRFEKRMRGAD
jgi:GNAT superfamily N-acetyltransferase